MNTKEHLDQILAKCHANLALAEKRTPGKWLYLPESKTYSNAPQMVWTQKGEGRGTVCETCSPGLMPYPDGQQAADAAFIAACAGPAEAGWRATIAAIEFYLEMCRRGYDAGFMADAILAAWPAELLEI